ncbi:MAG: hypothetical protein WAN35_20815 [Terracidiphilus sp.]
MRKFVRNILIVGVVAVLATLLINWDSYGYWPLPSMFGRHDARVDVAHGRFKILTYGLPTQLHQQYGLLLRQRYGVEIQAVAGCIVARYQQDYVDAYNEVSSSAIKRKYRRDIFKEANDEIKKNWNQSTAK